MPSPVVFVTHGIGIRGADRFDAMVARLQRGLGDPYRLVPIYWGDLAASDEYLDLIIGKHADSSAGVSEAISDAFGYLGHATHGRTRAWRYRAFSDSETTTEVRRHHRQERGRLKTRLRGFVHDQFREIRIRVSQWVLPYAGDVIVYQSPARRAAIHQRCRDVIREVAGEEAGTAAQPIRMIAHSLGGVMAFDLVCDPQRPLSMRHLITMGSQPAFFHVMDPRPGLEPFTGKPVALPSSLVDWTNLGDDHDLLSFSCSQVFQLHDGSAPDDRAVRCYANAIPAAASFQAHLGYWKRQAAIDVIGEALERSNEPVV